MIQEENKGIVYLLTNECMPGIVKIGMTSRADMDNRLKELYTTGVPQPFECVYACKVDCFKELEQALHEAFEPQRINPNREFFRISHRKRLVYLSFSTEVISQLKLLRKWKMTYLKKNKTINGKNAVL